MRAILLIMIGLSSLSLAEFSRDGGIVTDSISKLQWQDDAIGESMNWQDAIDHCENVMTLGGYRDWRLPNKNELLSIVDLNTYNPAIYDIFDHTISNDYWSSSSNASGTSSAWLVRFNDGYTYSYGKDYSKYVRCVRAGQ